MHPNKCVHTIGYGGAGSTGRKVVILLWVTGIVSLMGQHPPGTVDEPNYPGNDFVVYRLTEIYFNKAEALMRKNGGTATQEAVDLVNDCRQRAFAPADWPAEAYTTSTLTLEELPAERGREFIFEGKPGQI